MYPSLNIDLSKVRHNTRVINTMCQEVGLDVYAVTKVFCAIPEVAEVMLEEGVKGLADSRVKNIKRIKHLNAYNVMLRIPMQSEAAQIVEHLDLSFNSEITTIKCLNEEAKKQNKVHDILLMIDLGDLREGIFFESDYMTTVDQVMEMSNVNLKGLGTNLTCYGGIIPYPNTLNPLVEIKKEIETKYDFEIEILSAGNSSSLHLVEKNEINPEFNNLRLGESLVLGYETAFGNRIKDTYNDAFTLSAEIVELQEKPSFPIGEMGRDAFGNVPEVEDKGVMIRVILGIGRQDVNPDNLIPMDKAIEIIGASSDHLILDVTNSSENYQVGDIIDFELTYGSLLNLATSDYVYKNIK